MKEIIKIRARGKKARINESENWKTMRKSTKQQHVPPKKQ